MNGDPRIHTVRHGKLNQMPNGERWHLESKVIPGATISSTLFVHFMSNIFHDLLSPLLPQACRGAPVSRLLSDD